MSKKADTASALAGILRAKRGDDVTAPESAPGMSDPTPIDQPPPSPAPLPRPPSPVTPRVERPPPRRRAGKCSDKANYSQCSVYLRKDTRKKVKRALDDLDTGRDFSELVQELLEKWLTVRT